MMKDNQAQMAAVQVALRIRPLTERDRAQPRFAHSSSGDVLRALEKQVQIVPQNKYFTYDHVFGPDSHQSDIFALLGEKPVQKFVEGYNVTMLAYGQTSSGKTYTMGTAQHTGTPDPNEEGIVPRAMALLFDQLQQVQHDYISLSSPAGSPVLVGHDSFSKNTAGKGLRALPQYNTSQKSAPSTFKYSVKVSFVEIYNEELIDLLNSAPPSEKPLVTIREDTKGHIYWTGVKEMTVNNTDDVLYYLQQGTQNRATGSTDMNEKSSRSHAIFSVTLKQEKWVPSSPQSSRADSPIVSKLQQQSKLQRQPSTRLDNNNSSHGEDGDWIMTSSKFHFVDLAGSERLKRTAAEGDRRKEGININAGLLALGNVISALGDPSKKSTHVPYRDSKLTRLLQDSLGGSAMTLMIACVSPAESNLSETLNTLQYANRARNIKNKMEKNEVEEWMTTDNLEFLRNTILKLKNESKLWKSGNGNHHNNIPTTPKGFLMQDNNHSNNRVMSDFSDDFSSASSPIANPDFDDLYHEQHVLIADLQQQVEELQKEAVYIKDRNEMVERELNRLNSEQHDKPTSDFDFQHLVEPVIEEYEKSISGLESQLAMIRAALSHSDQGFEEQQAKIEQCEAIIEGQEKTIEELRKRNNKLEERHVKDEAYVAELEKKLMTTVEETARDRDMMSELKGKILKLKEVDENTEHYIHDLETRLTAIETERTDLKTKLSNLIASNKEENNENNEKKEIEDQERQQETKVLQEKYETTERERHKLETQVKQLLMMNKSSDESEESSIYSTPNGSNTPTVDTSIEKDNRIRQLEFDFAHLEQDHQDTLKELDEVLARYQEALESFENLQATTFNNGSENNIGTSSREEEVQLLRKSIAHLEHELEMASKRESIFRQMTEEHNDSIEVENTLNKLEISKEDNIFTTNSTEAEKKRSKADQEFILLNLDTLQKKYEELKSKVQLQQVLASQSDEEDDIKRSQDPKSIEEIYAQYETQMLSYKGEIKSIAKTLKEIRILKADETKTAIATNNPENKILVKSISSLDKQFTEQFERMKVEAKRFSNDVIEMISLNSNIENEFGIGKSKDAIISSQATLNGSPFSNNTTDRGSFATTKIPSAPSSPLSKTSFIQPPSTFSNNSSNRSGLAPPQTAMGEDEQDHIKTPPTTISPEIARQHENIRCALKTRLSFAKHDLKMQKMMTCALNYKFKIAEIALSTNKKRTAEGENSRSTIDTEIEELMLKMESMRLQYENQDRKAMTLSDTQ